MQFIVKGKASGKIVKTLEISPDDFELNLMDFLLLNSIPVASSCAGVGICKKCTTASGLLSCSLALYDYINIFGTSIEFDYL